MKSLIDLTILNQKYSCIKTQKSSYRLGKYVGKTYKSKFN